MIAVREGRNHMLKMYFIIKMIGVELYVVRCVGVKTVDQTQLSLTFSRTEPCTYMNRE